MRDGGFWRFWRYLGVFGGVWGDSGRMNVEAETWGSWNMIEGVWRNWVEFCGFWWRWR